MAERPERKAGDDQGREERSWEGGLGTEAAEGGDSTPGRRSAQEETTLDPPCIPGR